MKLYDGGRAPNPRRVRIFIAEKQMPWPEMVPVDMARFDQRSAAFLALNPMGQTPVLRLDDGTALSETVAICRYLETLYPEPALMGKGALGQALVEMWTRRIEFGLYATVQAVFRHGHPGMATSEVPQVPGWAEVNRSRVDHHLDILEAQLARHAFVAGEEFSVADIVAGVTIDFLKPARLHLGDHHNHIRRWHAGLVARPSWSA